MDEITSVMIDETKRTLWETRNILSCIPEEMWNREYCGAPLYKHVYHTLHSLDHWFINPCDPSVPEPAFHIPALNDLDTKTDRVITRGEIEKYLGGIEAKIEAYAQSLTPELLREKPEGCRHIRLKLILGQLRHLYAHLGMIMGWIIAETGKWPKTVGLEHPIPEGRERQFS